MYAYGDLWRLLGMSAVRLGFTINDNGLHVRVAEIEATHPRDCLLRLTYKPREMMNYLRLDLDPFKAGFRTLDEVFTWATSSRFFRRECFEKLMGKPQQSKKAERPMYVNFITEWLPQHPDVGVAEDDRRSQRIRLTEEALETFDKRCEYRRMVEDYKQRLMKDAMWQKIVKTLPLEGKELGEAIKALKALLGWEDGVPVLCVEGKQSKRIPALEEEIVDSLILPWVVEHWQEAVTQNKR
ncbi:MAG: hypothetical protein L6R38_001624 [Xanthoria sp. 2 TBL-2021]|nr:MAG: hypothetical protein L6R38_001624 [Xanthoria sp. 2 TBL-2021]